ncbi:MAG: methyltransferase domain-containing protein [Candidatus Omnitrophica bacterium]|nr:methyltransferase domain-containing protein [Candidatus Omnitrophota bacterium]MBU1808658.1 methyltransferase domain-containing protein [Candidatus Omnitrophota bacterium]
MRRLWSHHFMPIYFQDRFMKENLSFIKGELLDIGCGDKPYEDLFRPFVKSHVGADSCDEADVKMDAHSIKFAAEAFDTVLATSVIEHCEEPAKVISEMRRVLKKGGHLVLTVPYIMFIHLEPRDFYRLTKYGLQYLLRDFDIVKMETIGGYWTSTGYLGLQYLARFFDKLKIRFLLGVFCVFLQPVFLFLDHLDRKSSEVMTQGYMAIARKR